MMLPEASILVPEPISLSDMDVGFLIDIGYTPLEGGCAIGELPGDFDNNGTVEFADFSDVGRKLWHGSRVFFAGAMRDCNGLVEFADFLTLAENFGKSPRSGHSIRPGTIRGELGCDMSFHCAEFGTISGSPLVSGRFLVKPSIDPRPSLLDHQLIVGIDF